MLPYRHINLQPQSDYPLFKMQRFVKDRNAQICAPPAQNRFSEFDGSYSRCLWERICSVIIIAQRDAKNIEYWIIWLQKIRLEQPLFE